MLFNVFDMIAGYLKFKGITIIGIILYPVLAPIFLLFLTINYLVVAIPMFINKLIHKIKR